MNNEGQMGGQGLMYPVEGLAAVWGAEGASGFHEQGEGSRGLDMGIYREAW